MIVYKLFRKKKNGDITSLFINKSVSLPINEWMTAKRIPTKGFAIRPGWHTMEKMKAPHLSKKNRVWYKVEIENFDEIIRPESQGGKWFLAKNMRIVREV